MTPTEQDKELRRAIVYYRIKCDYYLSDRDEGVISQEEYETAISSELDSVVELFTADRKRVAMEARLDENNMYIRELTRHYFPSSPSEPHIPLVQFHERIAELKAKQEEHGKS